MDILLQKLITSNFFFARNLINHLTFKIYANSNANYKLFHSKCVLCENTFPPRSNWVHGFVVAHLFLCDDCTDNLKLNTNLVIPEHAKAITPEFRTPTPEFNKITKDIERNIKYDKCMRRRCSSECARPLSR